MTFVKIWYILLSDFNFDGWLRQQDSFGDGKGIYVSQSHDVEAHKGVSDYMDVWGNASHFEDTRVDTTDSLYFNINGVSGSIFHHVGAEIEQWDSQSVYGDNHGVYGHFVDETYVSYADGHGGGSWGSHVETNFFSQSYGHDNGIGLPFSDSMKG